MGTACILVTAEWFKHAAIAQVPTEANETMHVKVIGSNPAWTKISGVEANTLIRVNASGAVFLVPILKRILLLPERRAPGCFSGFNQYWEAIGKKRSETLPNIQR